MDVYRRSATGYYFLCSSKLVEIISLTMLITITLFDGARSTAPSLASGMAKSDESICSNNIRAAIDGAGLSSTRNSEHWSENAIHFVIDVVGGDYVDVGGFSAPGCVDVGMAGLIAAISQRVAMNDPYCRRNETVQKRAVWLALGEEGCLLGIKQLFERWGFDISDESSKSNDVPIHLLVGSLDKILPNAPIGNIALLRLGFKGSKGSQSYKDSLRALFALYRRVAMNGLVVVHSCEGQCKTGVDEFFRDGNHTMLSSSPFATSFLKRDVQVRVTPNARRQAIVTSIDWKVGDAWRTLDDWHRETESSFFGHVGNNAYQTYRYVEAMRHVIQWQKEKRPGKETTVNVCETGFNGGHSAMLFLSFLENSTSGGVNVNYWGWDLKEVGSASPIAEKMKSRFGNNFHIFWGDSKVTLKEAKENMGGQRCHLVVVDGEHSREGVMNDLNNFLKVSEPGAVVFGDDCAPYKSSVPKSEEMLNGWVQFVRDGRLISVANYRNPDLGSPGFVEGLVPSKQGSFVLGL